MLPLVLTAHEVVLHLVAAGDVPEVLDLKLLQQILLGDSGQQLGLAAEMVTVLVIILVLLRVQRHHDGEVDPVVVAGLQAPVEALRVPDALVLAHDHAPALGLAGVSLGQLLAEVLRLHHGLGGSGLMTSPVTGLASELAVFVMFVMMSVLPELHEEQSDSSWNHGNISLLVSAVRRNITKDDEHEGEVVAGLGVAAVDVDVAGQGDAHQEGQTAHSLHKTPAPGKMLGSNPANKEMRNPQNCVYFFLPTFER